VVGYEPYFAAPTAKQDFPLWDERLKRWGGDKVWHVHELASRGYSFWCVPGAAVVHIAHGRMNKAWKSDGALNKNPFSYFYDLMSLEDNELLPRSKVDALVPESRTWRSVRDVPPCGRIATLLQTIDAVRAAIRDVYLKRPLNETALAEAMHVAAYTCAGQQAPPYIPYIRWE
jgi:hypothetical protein